MTDTLGWVRTATWADRTVEAGQAATWRNWPLVDQMYADGDVTRAHELGDRLRSLSALLDAAHRLQRSWWQLDHVNPTDWQRRAAETLKGRIRDNAASIARLLQF